jgi:hypothetical protein
MPLVAEGALGGLRIAFEFLVIAPVFLAFLVVGAVVLGVWGGVELRKRKESVGVAVLAFAAGAALLGVFGCAGLAAILVGLLSLG